jgi:hypothetical protein
MRFRILVCMLAVTTIGTICRADDKDGVCKITTRTHWAAGRTEVDMVEVAAHDRDECKKKTDEKTKIANPKEIVRIDGSFSFRESAD